MATLPTNRVSGSIRTSVCRRFFYGFPYWLCFRGKRCCCQPCLSHCCILASPSSFVMPFQIVEGRSTSPDVPPFFFACCAARAVRVCWMLMLFAPASPLVRVWGAPSSAPPLDSMCVLLLRRHTLMRSILSCVDSLGLSGTCLGPFFGGHRRSPGPVAPPPGGGSSTAIRCVLVVSPCPLLISCPIPRDVDDDPTSGAATAGCHSRDAGGYLLLICAACGSAGQRWREGSRDRVSLLEGARSAGAPHLPAAHVIIPELHGVESSMSEQICTRSV